MRLPAVALSLLATFSATAADAQQSGKPIDAEDLVSILDPRAGPLFQADQIAAILHPAGEISHEPPSGREPGAWGSGVLPDLHVRFEPGSAELAPTADAQLEELAAALNGELLKPYHFEVRGHTDAVGSAAANERLAQARAGAVVARLRDRYAVAGSRIEAVGVGERELADPGEPESEMNRRVEIRTVD